MPQGRIITRVLKENSITYNDFLLQFGKVSHVRTESKDYDLYVKRFKEVSDNIGHALCGNELMNNKYGLPNPIWFVKYCPDKNVKNMMISCVGVVMKAISSKRKRIYCECTYKS